MAANSNIDEVTAWLAQWLNGVDFARPGKDKSLGLDITHAVAMGMQKRASQDQTDADGTPWAPNADNPPGEGYATWKEHKYGWVDQPGYRTGQTWSLLNLLGTTTVSSHELIMRGGIDEPPSSSAAPTGYISAADKRVTGRDKLRWAHEATANKPARPGYALADEDVTAVMEICTDWVTGYVIATNNT
jgi:hypothetical protein